jgi:hypothetical protein
LNGWDIALIAGVSIMGTALAYVRHPERKAFVLMLPVPFTLTTLSLGKPVDATNVLGMGTLFGFTIGVWALHTRLRWPILAAIAASAAGYCAVGAAIARLRPAGDAAFWGAAALMLAASFALIRSLPYREEPHYRTPLPVWIKMPAIALVITGVLAVKQHLGGFTTMFPMVGLVAAYEARKSLWTIVRRIPWVILMMTPMMALIRLTQGHIGLPAALAVAWPVLLTLLWALRKRYTGGEDA